MAPALPARKMQGGKRVAAQPSTGRNLPILQAQEIELEDGTKIPVKIPPGMPPAQAEALLAYLKTNPEAAKAAYAQAEQIMKTPGMASAFLNMQTTMQAPDMAEKYQALKDDPDLKVVFDDVVANGPQAFQKYWDDTDLMAKIASKMRGLNVSPEGPAVPATSLHDAAKKGDLAAAAKFIEEGTNVDEPNERGITPLGVAVGFNQQDMVKLLLEKGASLTFQDPAGNSLLHYAAGYGRKAVAQLLIDAGADLHATNKAGQKAVDAARMNGEKQLVELLQGLMGEAEAPATPEGADAPVKSTP